MSSGSSPSVSNLAEGLSPSAFQGVMVNNQDRINRIVGIVDDYYDDDSSGVTDLIADSMYYCREADLNFEECVLAARMHFESEQ